MGLDEELRRAGGEQHGFFRFGGDTQRNHIGTWDSRLFRHNTFLPDPGETLALTSIHHRECKPRLLLNRVRQR